MAVAADAEADGACAAQVEPELEQELVENELQSRRRCAALLLASAMEGERCAVLPTRATSACLPRAEAS